MSAGRVGRATMHKPNDSSNTCKKESWPSEGLVQQGPMRESLRLVEEAGWILRI